MDNPVPVPAPVPEPPKEAPVHGVYKDDDLVYVDPDLKVVVGHLQWSNTGKPKSLPVPEVPVGEKEGRRGRRRKFYPWGTYRSMKKIYKIEGKVRSEPPTSNLDEVIEKALKEPYWDA